MIGSVGQGDSTPKITLSEFSTPKELMEKEMDARVKREWKACINEHTYPTYTCSRNSQLKIVVKMLKYTIDLTILKSL